MATKILISPLDVKARLGEFHQKEVIVGGIFNIQLLNYDKILFFPHIYKINCKKPVYWTFFR